MPIEIASLYTLTAPSPHARLRKDRVRKTAMDRKKGHKKKSSVCIKKKRGRKVMGTRYLRGLNHFAVCLRYICSLAELIFHQMPMGTGRTMNEAIFVVSTSLFLLALFSFLQRVRYFLSVAWQRLPYGARWGAAETLVHAPVKLALLRYELR